MKRHYKNSLGVSGIKLLPVLGLISVLAGPSASFAAEGQDHPFKVKGHFRLRAEGNDRTDFTAGRDFMPLRVRAELSYQSDPALGFVVTPQFSRVFGESAYVSNANTGVTTRTQTSGGTSDPSLMVHEAYAVYQPVEWLMFKPGRQVLSYGDELVVGALDWNNVGRSFDAVKVRAKHAWGWTDVLFSKLVDNNTVSPGLGGDQDLYGLYSSGSPFKEGNTTDLYLLYQRDSSTQPKTHLVVAGLRTAGKFDSLDYRVEMTKESGNVPGQMSKAYQGDFEVGYTFATQVKPRLGFEYFQAGSDYNQLYPTTHKWLGYADVLGRKNLKGFVVHGSFTPVAELDVRADFHSFDRVDTAVSAYRANGTTTLGSGVRSSSAQIGTEFDLTLVYRASPLVTLSTGASYFNSGSYLKDQFGDIKPMFYFAQFEAKL